MATKSATIAAKATRDIQRNWRKADSTQRQQMRTDLIDAFVAQGFAPHEVFGFMGMIEGLDPIIRLLNIVRDDLVLRRAAIAAANSAVLGEGKE